MLQVTVKLPAHPSCDASHNLKYKSQTKHRWGGCNELQVVCVQFCSLGCPSLAEEGQPLTPSWRLWSWRHAVGSQACDLLHSFCLFWLLLSLNQNKPLRDQKQLFFEIFVRGREWEWGLLWDWYCHTTDVIVPLLTREPWLSLSRFPFASDNKPNSCPQLNIFSCTTYVHFWSMDYFFSSSLHLFFCLWGTLVTMEMTTSSGWVELREV